MKSVIAVSILLFAIAGCTSSSPTAPTVGCQLETDVANGIAGAVSTTLSCTNQTQIASDVLAAAGKANLCASQVAAVAAVKSMKARNSSLKLDEKGVIGDVACPLIVNALSSAVLAKVPTNWGCAGGTTVASITALVTTKCEALVTF